MKTNISRLIPAVIIFILGLLLTIIGSLFTLQHWPFGTLILTMGLLLEAVGVVAGITTLIKAYCRNV